LFYFLRARVAAGSGFVCFFLLPWGLIAAVCGRADIGNGDTAGRAQERSSVCFLLQCGRRPLLNLVCRKPAAVSTYIVEIPPFVF
jgi:hypothetical protein